MPPKEENGIHLLLKCGETRRRTEIFFGIITGLNILEETYNEITNGPKIVELTNLGNFLHKTKCK